MYDGRIWPLRLCAEHLGYCSGNLPPTLLDVWESPGLAAASLSRPVPGMEAVPDPHMSTSSGPFHGPGMVHGSWSSTVLWLFVYQTFQEGFK